ncbi:hypothetical protein ACB098_01G076900 [Castanea mollissima]
MKSVSQKKKTFNEILTLILSINQYDWTHSLKGLKFNLKAQLANLWATMLAILGIFWAIYSLTGLELGYSISENPTLSLGFRMDLIQSFILRCDWLWALRP